MPEEDRRRRVSWKRRGIPTYLHVPSPGLVKLFLDDGARRFIFEGRECGGHVGPRTSFVLWESMVRELLRFERPEELSIFFAGGIHDARSAAMVEVLASPLSAAGAKVGVLMGTSYLFTKEAVETGAILPGFQSEALTCDETVLVETAPGHATRCADTAFAEAFRQARARLEAEGKSKDEVWAELEQMNLGRLRLAAKGIERRGDNLVAVDEQIQRREGMYMMGQVAGLRTEVTTCAELHREVSEGSVAYLASRTSSASSRPRRTRSVDVAIIGMAGFYPGSEDLEAFWSNVVKGVDAVTTVPEERWNVDMYYDPEPRSGKTRSKWGGFLPEIEFDPMRYGIPPRSLAAVEPVQLLALEAAARALDDAGYGEREFDREMTSVIFGAEAGTDLASAYGFRSLYPQYLGEIPEALDEILPRLTEDSFPGVLANVIAGRIANRLDLGGVNYTVDAACASSLAALELGAKELNAGTSDMVLCGGADLHNAISDYLMFSSVTALSPRGRSATFDASADGIALGEGVAVLVCKRLEDAERDGDRIYAVVKGIAGSSDGRSLGLTAPRKEGQMRALRRTYDRSGISPQSVGLVEAHGTGTVVGDRIELASLTEVYSGAGTPRGRATLGSVKSNVGHTKCAAGLAGVIKIARAIHHRVLPSTLHLEKPNPGWDARTSPFSFRTHASPWPEPTRRAAVSAFGFGGTNFHAVLESPPSGSTPSFGLAEWPVELFVFRSEQDLDRVGELLAGPRRFRLRDLAAACHQGDGPARLAIVADDLEDLAEKVAAARRGATPAGVFRPGGVEGKLAYLFPGQGSQRPGMMADLLVAFPQLQEPLEEHPELASIMYPPAAFTPDELKAQKAALTDTRRAQPALGVVELAAARLLGRLGLRPAMMAGHSYGELAALCAAGAIPPSDLVRISSARASAILDSAPDDPGTMAAVSAPADRVGPIVEGIDGVVIANLNAPRQTVVSGTAAAMADALAAFERDGIAARAISVACAFHSPLLQGAPAAFARTLREVAIGGLQVPVYSNTTAEPHRDDPGSIKERLTEHLVRPVRFVDEIERMYADGARVFLEVGPGRVLSGLVGKILGERPHRVLALDGDPMLPAFLSALAELCVSGRDIDLSVLFEGRGARPVELGQPAPAASPTTWLVNGHRAVPLKGKLPDFAMQLVERPLSLVPAQSVEGDRESVIMEYLRSQRDLAESQRQVVLSYLGQAPAEPVTPRETVVSDVTSAPLPAPAEEPVAAEEGPQSRSDLEGALLGIVSERTGYPEDMLDLDLDLEADLSIDSIKRMEILGQMAQKLGLAETDKSSRDKMMEELAAIKSLRGVLDRIEESILPEAPPNDPVDTAAEVEVPPRTLRFVPTVEDAPGGEPGSLEGRRIRLEGGPPELVEALTTVLQDAGAERVEGGESETLVDLTFYRSAEGGVVEPLYRMADRVRTCLDGGARTVVAVTSLGGRFGMANGTNGGNGRSGLVRSGVGGLFKSVAREWPEARVLVLDVDPEEPVTDVAAAVCEELGRSGGPVEVGRLGRQRLALRFRPAELPEDGPAPLLDQESVVLLTGGARGITARLARTLASAYRCRLILVGRSALPEEPEPDALKSARSETDLRRTIVEQGLEREPARVEALCRRTLALREMRSTIESIREAGAEVEYRSVDVRDADSVTALVDGIYAKHGRLDAIFHGAGITEDKLLRDKLEDSFHRVVSTKVDSAEALLAGLRPGVRWVVFFSSVASAFGNRGQSDYAAANDVLDKLAHAVQSDEGVRVVSINWGPWAGGGMVGPELEREYERRGIGLIDPDDGIACLLRELSAGREPQVVLMRALPEHMG